MQVVHSSHLWGQLGVLGATWLRRRGRAEGLLLLANEERKPSAYALWLFQYLVVGGLLVLLAHINQGLE